MVAHIVSQRHLNKRVNSASHIIAMYVQVKVELKQRLEGTSKNIGLVADDHVVGMSSSETCNARLWQLEDENRPADQSVETSS